LNVSATTQSEARLLEVVLPEHADRHGALNGADALQLMGKAASVCATRHADCAVVMAKADQIEFVRPIRAGSTLDVRARVVFQGQSSMTVIVEMAPDAPGAQEEPAYVSGRFMMVAVNAEGIPIPIPASDRIHS
jgi:acyl-CoA hydrolase